MCYPHWPHPRNMLKVDAECNPNISDNVMAVIQLSTQQFDNLINLKAYVLF